MLFGLLDFLIFLKVFFTGLYVETNTALKLVQLFFSFQSFDFFCVFKVFLKTLQKKLSTRPTCKKVPYLEVLCNSNLAFRDRSRIDFRKLLQYVRSSLFDSSSYAESK